jgi:sec-independent protein translocase protein TatA
VKFQVLKDCKNNSLSALLLQREEDEKERRFGKKTHASMFFLRSPFTIFVQLNEKHGVMTHTLLFLGLGMQEILLIALVVLLFFGGKKIPELMKGLGKGVKSFKDGMNGLEEDKKEEANKEDKQ